MSDDREAIEAATRLYLDGLYEGDVEKLAASFHETSALTHEAGGKLTIVPREEWLAMVRNRPSPQAQGLARHDEILMVDQSSPTTAFVKVQCALLPRFFTDYLVLMKLNEGWRIVSKSYRFDVRE